MLDSLDAVTASLKHHRVLLENDHIRVLETILRPGEETALHTHIWPGYLYVLSWSDFERFDEHGSVVMDSSRLETTPQPGTAVWSAPLALHSLRNVGQRNIHVIMTEFKNGIDGRCAPAERVTLLTPETVLSDLSIIKILTTSAQG